MSDTEGRFRARRPRVQCLERAADILEALAGRPGMGVTETAAAVGLHTATVHNILSTLLSRNYVLNEGGRYRLGPALGALAARGGPAAALPRLALPRLESITRATGESAVVAVLSGSRVVMAAATPSDDGLSCPAPNQVFPRPLGLATGRLLVAHLPAGRRAEHVAQELRGPGRPAGGPATPDAWEREFAAIRAADLCETAKGAESGSAAVPVRDATGTVIAALGSNSIGRLGNPARRRRWVAAVVEAGRLLSLDLGHRPDGRPQPKGRRS